MRIVVTGGGSGGHITPILAVAAELKKQRAEAEITFIGQTGDSLADIPAADPSIDAVHTIYAGKFRRYYGEGWGQLLDLPTQYKNIRDFFLVLFGCLQSIRLLRKLRPAIIFTRGGFVSVPVGLAAALLHIPYITHDSDIIPSLANRIIARWATLHAVAMPKELYDYPADKTVTVGIPISSDYQPVSAALQQRYKAEIGFVNKDILLVTGGGNGAHNLNQAVIANAAYLLKKNPKLAIVHIAGRALEAGVNHDYDQVLNEQQRSRVAVHGFVTDLYRYSAASDIIIARGSATNLAEFAIQAKACLIVPAPMLVWTIKNAEALQKSGAIVMLDEAQAEQERRLAITIEDLLVNPEKRATLAANLASFARPNAASQLAMVLLDKAQTS